MHKTAKAKTKYLGVTAFRQQCELYLSVLDDALIHEHYVKMFIVNGNSAIKSENSKDQLSDDDLLLINQDGFAELLLTCFSVSIANYIASGTKTYNEPMNEIGRGVPAEIYCPYVINSKKKM